MALLRGSDTDKVFASGIRGLDGAADFTPVETEDAKLPVGSGNGRDMKPIVRPYETHIIAFYG